MNFDLNINNYTKHELREMLFASIFNFIHDEYIVYKKNYGKLKWVCGIQLEGNKLQNYDIIIDFDILKKLNLNSFRFNCI